MSDKRIDIPTEAMALYPFAFGDNYRSDLKCIWLQAKDGEATAFACDGRCAAIFHWPCDVEFEPVAIGLDAARYLSGMRDNAQLDIKDGQIELTGARFYVEPHETMPDWRGVIPKPGTEERSPKFGLQLRYLAKIEKYMNAMHLDGMVSAALFGETSPAVFMHGAATDAHRWVFVVMPCKVSATVDQVLGQVSP